MEDLISPQLISAHRSLKAKLAWLIGVKQVFSLVDVANGPGESKQEERLNALTATIKASGVANKHSLTSRLKMFAPLACQEEDLHTGDMLKQAFSPASGKQGEPHVGFTS